MPIALEQIAQYPGNVPALRAAPGVQSGLGTALQTLRDIEIGFAVADEIKDRHDYKPDDGQRTTEDRQSALSVALRLSPVLCWPTVHIRTVGRLHAADVIAGIAVV